jgi:hypothetical protein
MSSPNEYGSIPELLEEVAATVRDYVANTMEEVKPVDLGLDPRCASVLYVSDEAIAVNVTEDRLIQYYGGFEYVHKGERVVSGDYVFYMSSDSRISGHIKNYMDKVEKEYV